MNYTFRGRLWGYICSECLDPLSNIKVRLYRTHKEQNVTSLAVALPKDTFAILSTEQEKNLNSLLIAEADTDADGNFTFELGEKQKYNGEAFEIVVCCTTVPHQEPLTNLPSPVLFTITTLQPLWRETEKGMVAVWEYGIPNRYWCAVLARCNTWVICGKVTVCGTDTPIKGIRVKAFDADWIQDDPLGSALTDILGRFHIFYHTSDFQKTPLSPAINFEWVGGPDVYFRIESPDGTPLLIEPSSKGRTPGRENIGNCFCVQLCIKEPPPGDVPTMPMFTNVGQYSVDPADNNFTPEGLTQPEKLAFTSTIPLIGILPDGQDPQAIEYRFREAEYDAAGVVLGATHDVDVSMIAPTKIGKLEYWSWKAVPGYWEIKAADYWVNNPGATVTIPQPAGPPLVVSVNKNVKPEGWIEVPRDNGLTPGGVGRFIPNGYLIYLITTKLTNESYDLTIPAPGTKAGDSVPAAKKSRAHTFKLFFEARVVGALPLLPGSNSLEKIIMSNTLYTYKRHPNWAGSTLTTRSVASLDIAELSGPGAGCGKLTNHAHVLYTVYHPFMGSARVYFEGNPPLPAELSLAIAGGESVSGAAGYDFDITALLPCAYILWLEATVNLTSGWGRIAGSTIWDHIAFCKG